MKPILKPIRARLLLGLMAGTLLCCGVAMFLLYVLADAAADEQADLRLRQLAENLPATLYGGSAWPAETAPEEQIVLQLWDGDRVIHSAGPDASMPLFVVEGYATSDYAGRRLRSYAAPYGRATVQVSQPVAVRQQMAGRIALRVGLPFVFLLPAMGCLIWFVVGSALAPVAELAQAVARISPRDLQPIAGARMPPDLAPIVGALNALLAQVDQAMQAQRNFVTDAAHELRSPLAALKLELQIAERSAALAKPGMAAQFGGIQARLDRATHMVNQLITLARHEPGSRPVEIVRKPRDLEQLARACVAEHAREAEMRNIDLGLAADSMPASALVDVDALMVALRNLVDNAMRYTPSGGKVDVGAGVADGRSFIRVTDNGPGIEAGERSRVFDRFFRGSGQRAARNATGCGIGMSIIKNVADLHEADVQLGDAPGGGLQVDVVFRPIQA